MSKGDTLNVEHFALAYARASAPCLDFFIFGIDVFARKRNSIVLRLFLLRDQQVVFCLQKVRAIVNGKFEVVPVRNRVLRTGLDTESAEDAAAVIDVVNLRLALVASDAIFVRPGIVLRFDVDAVRRTSRRAEITRDALFLTHLIDVQEVLSPIPRLDRYRNIRILHRPLLAWYLGQRSLHPLDDCDGRLNDI